MIGSLADDFNPHSRTGSDPIQPFIFFPAAIISIHTPARGVTVAPCQAYSVESDFNPHSRTGSDLLTAISFSVLFISIHTPARGVTDGFHYYNHYDGISIHTPARGVTGTEAL